MIDGAVAQAAVESAAQRRRAAPPLEDEEGFFRLTGLIPLAAACRHVGAAPATLRHHLADGACEGRKINRTWYVSRSSIERWALRHPNRAARAGSQRGTGSSCPCLGDGQPQGHRAAAQPLAAHAARVRALERIRDAHRQVAIDLLDPPGVPGRPAECAAWLAKAADEAAAEAGAVALEALLGGLARRLAAAPPNIIGSVDGRALHNAIELA
jgi:hypothetical protein